MERMDGVGPKRTQRVHRSITEKRRIVELVLQPGVSVARVAQAEGVNANQVFKWRRDYRSGQLVEAGTATALMLPVHVGGAGVELSAPIYPEPAAPTGAIHIELPGRATISVEHGADGALLQTILESLRK
ncbi:MAG TPA: transposase [Terracidiphilus sp.]|nr:transposase [Terracidiphilus sp.]HZL53637.1 transposase [Terracidiphilus sp.]